MRNVRLRLTYDGSCFYGWQRQDGFATVQEAVEDGLLALARRSVTVIGSGRTDAGVHALGQVAHAHVDTLLTDERLLLALNAHLPPGVVVTDLETCADDFHAQRSARGKRYMYRVDVARFRSPLTVGRAHWIPRAPDLDAMRRAARHLIGEHDFSALASAGSPRRTNVRRIRSLHVLRRRTGVAFVVQGNGFLYNMVRAIAGTLLEVGRGRLAPDALGEILASRDRSRAGPTAPPGGLYLWSVLYDEPCFGA